MLSAFLAPRARALAASSSSVCNEFRQQLFPQGSTSYVQIRTSTKRGGGTSRNGRDSAGRRLGVKKFGDEYVLPGQIIVRQRGTKFHAGQHIGMGRDHTLYALEPGYLKFYISEYAFPHQTPPRMLSQSLREVAKPGTIDNGDRPIKRAGSSKSWPDVNMPRGMRRFVGIVRDKADVLPRDERQEGRERRFWGVNIRASEADDTLPF